MGMGSKVGYGPSVPRGTMLPGKRAKRRTAKSPRITEASVEAARLHSSQPDRPKMTDTMTSRKRGGRTGMYVRPTAAEYAGRMRIERP